MLSLLIGIVIGILLSILAFLAGKKFSGSVNKDYFVNPVSNSSTVPMQRPAQIIKMNNPIDEVLNNG